MPITQLKIDLWKIDARLVRNGVQYRMRERLSTHSRKAAEYREHELIKMLTEKADRSLNIRSCVIKNFGDCLSFYLERHEAGRSSSLFDRLRYDLGPIEMTEFSTRFDAWFLSMRRHAVGERTGKPLSNGTLNRYLAWTQAILNCAVRFELIPVNPVKHYDRLREVPCDAEISDAEEKHLLNTLDAVAPHLGPIVRYALQVPSRKSELVNLRRGDLDLFNMCIRIRNGGTKNDQGIDKPIPPDMVHYFQSLPNETDYLFYRFENGKYLPLGDFKKSWNRVLKLAGLERLTFHSTRHIAATRLVDNGTPEQVVMQVAGWKTNMLRTYYNRNPKKALELVNFGKKCTCPSTELPVLVPISKVF